MFLETFDAKRYLRKLIIRHSKVRQLMSAEKVLYVVKYSNNGIEFTLSSHACTLKYIAIMYEKWKSHVFFVYFGIKLNAGSTFVSFMEMNITGKRWSPQSFTDPFAMATTHEPLFVRNVSINKYHI